MLEKSPFELSGGQKRRVAIAGVIAMEPRVLILDEPTAGLDPAGVESILGNIRDYHQAKNATIILVSHSMEEVARHGGPAGGDQRRPHPLRTARPGRSSPTADGAGAHGPGRAPDDPGLPAGCGRMGVDIDPVGLHHRSRPRTPFCAGLEERGWRKWL